MAEDYDIGLVRTRAALTALEGEWRALYAESRPRNPFTSFDWVLAGWEETAPPRSLPHDPARLPRLPALRRPALAPPQFAARPARPPPAGNGPHPPESLPPTPPGGAHPRALTAAEPV